VTYRRGIFGSLDHASQITVWMPYAVSLNNRNELADVMTTQVEFGQAFLCEFRGAVLISSVSYVHQFVLNQSQKINIAALGAIIGSQGDDEGRHIAEPITHLLFHPGLLPATSAERYLLGLAQDCSALLLEARRGPHDPDVCVQ
jgi:hypothetical protein